MPRCRQPGQPQPLSRRDLRRGGKAVLKRGFHPPYGEVYLDYAGQRSVRFRAGTDCAPTLLARANKLFDAARREALSAAKLVRLPTLLGEAECAGHDLRCYDA